jgi:hypothetical protein
LTCAWQESAITCLQQQAKDGALFSIACHNAQYMFPLLLPLRNGRPPHFHTSWSLTSLFSAVVAVQFRIGGEEFFIQKM